MMKSGSGALFVKGQHTINLAAMANVLETRGELGFNSTILIETGEETGSPGLRTFCGRHKDELAADVLIASDGPRLAPDRPTLFMGTRGALNFELSLSAREGGHHSGNWGGLLTNPGVRLAHALAVLVGADGRVLACERNQAPVGSWQLPQGGLDRGEEPGEALFREIAEGLSYAHGKGVLHCDLKPANILLDHASRPRLADFGQSRMTDDQTPSLGTLFFMAPEQADLQAQQVSAATGSRVGDTGAREGDQARASGAFCAPPAARRGRTDGAV